LRVLPRVSENDNEIGAELDAMLQFKNNLLGLVLTFLTLSVGGSQKSGILSKTGKIKKKEGKQNQESIL